MSFRFHVYGCLYTQLIAQFLFNQVGSLMGRFQGQTGVHGKVKGELNVVAIAVQVKMVGPDIEVHIVDDEVNFFFFFHSSPQTVQFSRPSDRRQ